jgi:hypothetical protein
VFGRRKVAILLPIAQSTEGPSVGCLCRMIHHSRKTDLVIMESTGSRLVDKCRNSLVEWAISQKDVTEIFFVDSDMTFPENTLERLISHNKDIVVGCAVSRGIAPVPFLFKGFDESGQPILWLEKLMNPNGDTLLKVGASASALMLIKAEVFRKVERPWFKFQDDLVGEDLYFSKKAVAKGFEIFVDLPLSEQMGHIGQDKRTLGMARMWFKTQSGQDFLKQNREILS